MKRRRKPSEIMCNLIHESAKDPLISQYALEAVRQWRGGAQFASDWTGCAFRSARNRGKHLVVVQALHDVRAPQQTDSGLVG